MVMEPLLKWWRRNWKEEANRVGNSHRKLQQRRLLTSFFGHLHPWCLLATLAFSRGYKNDGARRIRSRMEWQVKAATGSWSSTGDGVAHL